MSTDTTTPPATTTTPAATGTATPPPATGAAPAATPPAVEWTAALSDDLKGFVQKKGFQSPSNVVDSYKNLESLLGVKERLVTLPEKDDDAEGWSKIHDRLGRPASADKYDFGKLPENHNADLVTQAKKIFHDAGLSQKQAAKVLGWYQQFSNTDQTQNAQAYAAEVDKQVGTLKGEWGAAYDQQMTVAKHAAEKLGVTKEQIDNLERSMGYASVMKFFNSVGVKIGEDNFVGGGSGGNNFNGVLTPPQARNEIENLKQDRTFVEAFLGGGKKERDRMDQLHKWAYPEEMHVSTSNSSTVYQ